MAREMKTLGAVYHYDAYTDAIQAEVGAYFQAVLIEPIEAKLRETERRNSQESDALKAAIASGLVWYSDGAFHGRFSAEISAILSRIGAKYRKRSGAWQIATADIQVDVRQSIATAKSRTSDTVTALAALVLLMRSHVDDAETGIDLVPVEKRILDTANIEFNKALADFNGGVSAGIPADMKTVVDEINEAAKEDAKRVMREELDQLSQELAELKKTGAPMEELKKTIQRVKRRVFIRARAISEHAAALLLSRYRKAQAKRFGLSSYVWKTKRDNRVRHDHTLLEGKTFRWDDPPITNQDTGARNHPGEDFGCRCVPLNIVPTFDPIS